MIYQQGATFYPSFPEPVDYITGVSMYIKRASDNYFYDFNDSTFKASGWTTKGQALAGVLIDTGSIQVWTLVAGWTIPNANVTYHIYYKDNTGACYPGEVIQVGPMTFGIRKNTALNNFVFFMADSTDNKTAETGLTITATRSIDGAAFGSCTNSATEIANGFYKINLSAADLNGDVITFSFAGTGANNTLVTIKTNL